MTNSIPTNAQELIDALRFPDFSDVTVNNPALDKTLAALKIVAVGRNDQDEASKVWRAEKIAEVQRGFIEVFAQLKRSEFYTAWCQLEQCEIVLKNLRRHHEVMTDDPHRLGYIDRMIGRWQSLYPYKVFFSPEILKKKILCGICGSTITPRSKCGHEKGNLYNGEFCHHVIAELELLSISAVEHPVQRYSVTFLSNEDGSRHDQYNYDNIKFVVDRVSSPFHEWDSERTFKKILGSSVAHLQSDHPCPCLSGSEFSNCCSGKTELIIPHLEIEFYVQPPNDLPSHELLF